MTVHELLTQLENFVRANYVDGDTKLEVAIQTVDPDGFVVPKHVGVQSIHRHVSGNAVSLLLRLD